VLKADVAARAKGAPVTSNAYTNGLWAFTAHVNNTATQFVQDVIANKCMVTVNPLSFQRTSAVDGFTDGLVCMPWEGRNTTAITSGDLYDPTAYPFQVIDSACNMGMAFIISGSSQNNSFNRCKIQLDGCSSAQNLTFYSDAKGHVGSGALVLTNTRTLITNSLLRTNNFKTGGYGFHTLNRSNAAYNNWWIYDNSTILKEGANSQVNTFLRVSGVDGTAVTLDNELTNRFIARNCIIQDLGGTGGSNKFLGGAYNTNTNFGGQLARYINLDSCNIYGWDTSVGLSRWSDYNCQMKWAAASTGWNSNFNAFLPTISSIARAAGTTTITFAATDAAGDTMTHPFRVGDTIVTSGFATASNNGVFLVSAIGATTVAFADVGSSTTETGGSVYFLDNFSRNCTFNSTGISRDGTFPTGMPYFTPPTGLNGATSKVLGSTGYSNIPTGTRPNGR
jgi:hypothetical protein